MTGSAETSSATPVAGVAVAFKLAADLGSCGTCGLHSAVTDAAGTYSLPCPPVFMMHSAPRRDRPAR